MSPRPVTWALALCACVLWPLSPMGALSQPRDDSGSWTARIRENLVYHVIRLSNWPDSAFGSSDEPFSITVLGRKDERMAGLLRARGGFLDAHPARRPHGRRYTVRVWDLGAVETDLDRASLRAAQVLYVSETSRADPKAVLSAIRGAPVLSIGEGMAFAEAGGMVALVLEEGRIRPHIDLGAVQKAGLRIGAELLQHADIAHAGGSPR